MADKYGNATPGLESPLIGGIAITAGASALSQVTRAIWVGGAGNLDVGLYDGTRVTLTGVAAGSLLWLRAKYVYSDATTATAIVGLY